VKSTNYEFHYSSFSILLFHPVLGPDILITLFSNNLLLRTSRRVTDQVLHPYKTTLHQFITYGVYSCNVVGTDRCVQYDN